MAQQIMQSMFDELGLGNQQDEQIFQAHQQRNRSPANSAAGVRHNANEQMGQNVGQGIIGLFGGAKSFFGKNKDKTFKEGFLGEIQSNKDRIVAQAKGIPVEELVNKRATRRKLSSINVAETGDPFTDQMAVLDAIIKVAEESGDFDLITKANAKQMALKRNQADLQKLEVDTDAREKKTSREEAVSRRDFATGVDVVPVGANPRDKDFLPSSATFDPRPTPEFPLGHWNVIHPDGSTEQTENVQVFNPQALGLLRTTKVSDTALAQAIKQSGTGKAFAAKKSQLTDMAKTSKIAADVSDLFLSFRDPQALTAWFGKSAIVAGKAIRFGESFGRLMKGETGDTKYIDEFSQKEFTNDQIHYNGELMNGQKQKTAAMSAAAKIIEKMGGINEIIPEHLRAQLGEIERGAAQFQAMVMEMAFMDARLQEPSNRGLSDKDIEAALARIGAFAADPTVFINRQLQKARENLSSMETLGIEYSPTAAHPDTQALIDVTYNPAHLTLVKETIAANIAKLEQAKIDIMSGNTGPQAVPISNETAALSDEELDRQIAEAEAL